MVYFQNEGRVEKQQALRAEAGSIGDHPGRDGSDNDQRVMTMDARGTRCSGVADGRSSERVSAPRSLIPALEASMIGNLIARPSDTHHEPGHEARRRARIDG